MAHAENLSELLFNLPILLISQLRQPLRIWNLQVSLEHENPQNLPFNLGGGAAEDTKTGRLEQKVKAIKGQCSPLSPHSQPLISSALPSKSRSFILQFLPLTMPEAEKTSHVETKQISRYFMLDSHNSLMNSSSA